jgi:hypothetical protein
MSEQHMIRQAVATDEVAVRACAEQAYAQYVAVAGRKPAPFTQIPMRFAPEPVSRECAPSVSIGSITRLIRSAFTVLR